MTTKTHRQPFRIILSPIPSGRTQALARTARGDRTACGLSPLLAFLAVLPAVWEASRPLPVSTTKTA